MSRLEMQLKLEREIKRLKRLRMAAIVVRIAGILTVTFSVLISCDALTHYIELGADPGRREFILDNISKLGNRTVIMTISVLMLEVLERAIHAEIVNTKDELAKYDYGNNIIH